MKSLLADVVHDWKLKQKAEIACEINRLKREKGAIILGHNYMEPALYHSIPDYTGDSLFLSRMAAQSEARIVVFCGVRFMAETAKILNPSAKVLLPSPKGGCSLAEGVTAADIRELRKLYPAAPVVSYVNCYAEVKAESDYCCTSANAAAVVKALLSQGHARIIFVPDHYLAANTARETGMRLVLPERDGAGGWRNADIPPGNEPVMIGWKARCEVHERFTVKDIENARREFPDVVVLAHPECHPDVVAAADFSGSTSQMLRYLEEHPRGRYLLLTECSMADNIASRHPGRQMLRLCSLRCPHMQEVTLEETLESLRLERYEIDVPEAIRDRARLALDRMIGTW
ncbi:MAG: quinolinate synthase NadA [Planctomycetota bacterium]|nr:quinolinate synthase NadA [Planctomycetota bacterium]